MAYNIFTYLLTMISLVIPYLEIDYSKKTILDGCIESMKGQFDELIVVSDKIDNLARKINKGMLLAKGDYIIVCSDDIILHRGTLKDLCIDGVVTTPLVNERSEKKFHGHMFCIPRPVFAEIGTKYEGYDGFYFDDSDHWMQIESKGIEIRQLDTVDIHHTHPARTISQLPKEGRFEYNKRLFITRWGLNKLEEVVIIK